MPYRLLASDCSVQAGMRRIACEQIDKALAALETSEADRARAVHEVRKSCKKLRALVRLVRPAFPGYASENAAFREIGRALGDLRDTHVLLDTLDAVLADPEGQASSEAIAEVRAVLARRHEAEHAACDVEARLAEARGQLLAARERVGSWQLDAEGWEAIAPELGKTYRHAAKAMRRAGTKAASRDGGERHHDWRKRAKHHWYHIRLLRDLKPRRLKRRAKETGRLTELLGDDHDCHVLEAALLGDPSANACSAASETVAALSKRRRARLEREAARLGADLFADSRKKQVARFAKWWRKWQDKGAMAAA